jgi:hypothetical protein
MEEVVHEPDPNTAGRYLRIASFYYAMKGMIVMERVVAQHSRGYMFYCEGCKCNHAIGSGWTFNGDLIKSTFNPSVLVTSGHYMEGHKGDCWCSFNAKHPDEPAPFACFRCHSFVTDGKIQYLNDCTHELAGQTIDLKPID